MLFSQLRINGWFNSSLFRQQLQLLRVGTLLFIGFQTEFLLEAGNTGWQLIFGRYLIGKPLSLSHDYVIVSTIYLPKHCLLFH